MNGNLKLTPHQRREVLAETIYVHLVVGNHSGQYARSHFAEMAREMAKEFYPDDELPSPSVQVKKGVQ